MAALVLEDTLDRLQALVIRSDEPFNRLFYVIGIGFRNLEIGGNVVQVFVQCDIRLNIRKLNVIEERV